MIYSVFKTRDVSLHPYALKRAYIKYPTETVPYNT